MRLFLDTNVMLDLLATRLPFYEDIAKIVMLAENGDIKLAASAVSFVNANYVLAKISDQKSITEVLQRFRIICEVAVVDEIIIDKSLLSNFSDFEDATQYFSAMHHKSDCIISRNGNDFKNSEIPVLTAAEFLASINKK